MGGLGLIIGGSALLTAYCNRRLPPITALRSSSMDATHKLIFRAGPPN